MSENIEEREIAVELRDTPEYRISILVVGDWPKGGYCRFMVGFKTEKTFELPPVTIDYFEIEDKIKEHLKGEGDES